ncbi:hypothetical protein [Flagellimonas sp.]|uniref:hypothetical protein n=1 Tax=Flagellimonas sp. TaxID=2058762 RepID=UPI003BAC2072
MLKRIAKAVKEEINKPQSFAKGEAFEEYVRKFVFPKEHYKLLRRTHDYRSNNEDYIEDSMLPDFDFECIKTGKKFHVEAKFRNGVYNHKDKIEWCKPFQLKRYQELDKVQDVFIVLGLGNKASRPEEIILFPLKSCTFTGLYDSFLDKYSFPYIDKPVFSSYLWKLK